MTRNPEALRSPGPTEAQRDHRLRDGVDALGFPLIPLTLRKSRRIVKMRKADNSIREERAATPRLALIGAATPDSSPLGFGGSSMSCDHGSFVPSRVGSLRRVIRATGALLALGAGLWLGNPARAQETQIIYPGSMAVTGFPGTVIPNFDEGLPPGVDPLAQPPRLFEPLIHDRSPCEALPPRRRSSA